MSLCEQSLSYVRAIAPYQPGKPISELARAMGLDEKKIVKLASNENPFGVSPKAKAAIKRELAELALYPHATLARGAEGIVVPAKDYAHDLEAMLAAITPETRLVFIANPNNPTG